MAKQQKLEKMKELVIRLDEAARAYYQEDREIMSNLEYDTLYDELVELEKETGTILNNSPTVKVGYEVLSELPKENHQYPMLSLDKTKDTEALKDWLGDNKGILSWKLDGLTVVLTYEDGHLVKAVTRGNGQIGEVITNNAKTFKNIPQMIPYKGQLVVRGEAVIKYSDFNKINALIEDVDAKYKNPRNLCSGSVRQLNNEITAKRNVNYFIFSLVQAEGVDFENSRAIQLNWLAEQGFEVVEYAIVDSLNIEESVQAFAGKITDHDIPSDGLVLILDDIAYSQSLGTTAKFPRDSIAFKWADETSRTKLIEIEWSASRTGLINPVAIFEPVELEGTTVARASVHNLSIVEALALGIGDEIEVYKANMIIPQIAENHTRSNTLEIPEECPVCHGQTEIRELNDVKSLYCTNSECQAKKIKSFTHFVSRNAFNIEGMSEATLEKFIGQGFLKEFADIFHLGRYEEQIIEMEGLGEKSYMNLIAAIEKARHIELGNFVYSLGILNIGLANAKLICKSLDYDIERIMKVQAEELIDIQGIGPIIAQIFVEYFADEKNQEMVRRLLKEVELKIPEVQNNAALSLEGKTFVITGAVEHYKNRNELKNHIETLGGKVAGSVSSKTDYLINNDVASSSSKNKKARELGIPILSEADFLELIK